MDSIRNNLFWKEDNMQNLFSGGYIYSTAGTGEISNWTEWRILGGTGINADPLFVKHFGHESNQLDLNGELKPNSPAINKGEDIQPYLDYFHKTWGILLPNEGINGIQRDNTPTIGAYEYK